MENLRWILLIAGLAVLALVYWSSRRRAEAAERDEPQSQSTKEAGNGNGRRVEPTLSMDDLNDPLFAPTPDLGLQVDPGDRQPSRSASATPQLDEDDIPVLQPGVLNEPPTAVEEPETPAPAQRTSVRPAEWDEDRHVDVPPPIQLEPLTPSEPEPAPEPEGPSEPDFPEPVVASFAPEPAAEFAEPEFDEAGFEAGLASEPEPLAEVDYRDEPPVETEPVEMDVEVAALQAAQQPELQFDAEPQALGGSIEEKLLVLHVVSGPHEFVGPKMLQLFEERGYEHGEMGIFHSRYEGHTVFSLANLVEPGYFEPARMDGFTTPGVTLFMRLPGPLPAEVAFDVLISESQELAAELGGEVQDAEHSTLTRQRIQSLREEVQEFIHRNRLAAPSQRH